MESARQQEWGWERAKTQYAMTVLCPVVMQVCVCVWMWYVCVLSCVYFCACVRADKLRQDFLCTPRTVKKQTRV